MLYFFGRRTGSACQPQCGFTLIELLIAVVIIGIIAGIAYPNYTRYIERSIRTDAHTALLQAASEMERCYANRYRYDDCEISSTLSASGHYSIRVENNRSREGGYLLTAVASRSDGCNDNITLNARGERLPEVCW
ncbi:MULTISPECIES: type IV pilin protein [unclassified Halomonas]|uniref:type IV pilin protein n=1 Tax=unclassified Halomonas TaxID=2609666 RepID=UPI00099087A7|nr:MULTISPECIES: type IV pilin protein [unclassified Halomonas]AQU83652.1 type IV pilin [Halomonas sp. 'Soap Lake \